MVSTNPVRPTLEMAVEILLDAASADRSLQLLPWLEREFTLFAMKRTKGNQVKAAKLLGVTRATLRKANRALWHHQGAEFSVDCSAARSMPPNREVTDHGSLMTIGPGHLHSHAVMSEQLADLVDSIRNFEPILELLRRKGLVTLDHVCEGAQAFVAACVVRHHSSRSCWILCPDVRRQEDIFNGLLNWQIEALFFPEIELPAVKESVPDPEIVAERLEVLQKIAEGKRVVVVLTESSLGDAVPSAQVLQKQTLILHRNDRLDRDALCESLLKSGYEKTPQVTTRGQFAVRGGILDIFSWHHSLPVRIELFGDDIDSIREFELDDQTSIQTLDRCELLIADTEQLNVDLRDYVRKPDVLIGIESESDEAKIQDHGGNDPGRWH